MRKPKTRLSFYPDDEVLKLLNRFCEDSGIKKNRLINMILLCSLRSYENEDTSANGLMNLTFDFSASLIDNMNIDESQKKAMLEYLKNMKN